MLQRSWREELSLLTETRLKLLTVARPDLLNVARLAMLSISGLELLAVVGQAYWQIAKVRSAAALRRTLTRV